MNDLEMVQASKSDLLDPLSHGHFAGLRAGTVLAVCFASMLGWVSRAEVAPKDTESPAAAELVKYRRELQALRAEFGGSRELPDTAYFKEYRYPQVLRVLHQELLVNVIDGKPVPNFFVYTKPWYRDGAMMAMCFKATGNLDLIRDWVLGLTEPYDRNNNGETEADNLGQALYLVSLVSDKYHPLVAKVLNEMPRFEVDSPSGKYLKGRSDFSFHTVCGPWAFRILMPCPEWKTLTRPSFGWTTRTLT
jgi:hypothetical protein